MCDERQYDDVTYVLVNDIKPYNICLLYKYKRVKIIYKSLIIGYLNLN